MSLTASEMTPADIAAVTNNNGNCNGGGWGNGMWGDWIILFLFAAMFGWGGGGFGGGFGGFGGGGGGRSGCGSPCATQADVRAAVDQQTLINKLDQQTYGLADVFNSLNNAIMGGFHGVDNAVCTLGYQTQQGFNQLGAQLAQCCCSIERSIDANTTQGVMNTNAIQRQISDCCCDIEKMNMQSRFDAQTYNCNTLQAIDKLGDRIIDYMASERMQNLRDENQALRLAASQSNQNAVLMAAMDANTATILRRTGAECPTAAYLVQPPTPVNFPVNGCGQVQFGGGWGNNCGCG